MATRHLTLRFFSFECTSFKSLNKFSSEKSSVLFPGLILKPPNYFVKSRSGFNCPLTIFAMQCVIAVEPESQPFSVLLVTWETNSDTPKTLSYKNVSNVVDFKATELKACIGTFFLYRTLIICILNYNHVT